MESPNLYNPDDFDTKVQADEMPDITWDEPMDDDEEAELSEDVDELDEEIDPFDDDDDIDAKPDADDEDNWDAEDDAQGRWSGELIYGYDREMSETEAAFYGQDRDYDAMNEYYGDDDE
jgi:hypothetical protein